MESDKEDFEGVFTESSSVRRNDSSKSWVTRSIDMDTSEITKYSGVPLFNPFPSSCCWISRLYTSSLCFPSL
ncbi:hypothetical protein ACLOJK_035190 [Asimina triloba]